MNKIPGLDTKLRVIDSRDDARQEHTDTKMHFDGGTFELSGVNDAFLACFSHILSMSDEDL